jgi:hypothetical protein
VLRILFFKLTNQSSDMSLTRVDGYSQTLLIRGCRDVWQVFRVVAQILLDWCVA